MKKVREKDYNRLKELAGKEVADEYFKYPDSYDFKRASWIILKYELMWLYKNNKPYFILIVLLALFLCWTFWDGFLF
ncbi:hypothetical protein EYV94_23000 [Puteibacter caeruleilacunae]|nr:hypothetical protein EYV94_23000 [Puteibacter caeruleilacunae]